MVRIGKAYLDKTTGIANVLALRALLLFFTIITAFITPAWRHASGLRSKCLQKMQIKQKWIFNAFCFFIVIISLSGAAGAATVTYNLNATANVSIGADGTTNVIPAGTQTIPPIITAIMITTAPTASSARSASHPTGLYNHSRWYFTSDYPSPTQIGANPGGNVSARGAVGDTVIVRLYDYDSATGTKTLIGSSSSISVTASTASYKYTISSSAYTVPQNHRLMLQIDFNETTATTSARVYTGTGTSLSNLTVTETPQAAGTTYNISGYVTNKSSGVPLSGAMVQTNTSLTTDTNATGFYNFTGLSNGTYRINATLTGYAVNSINVTINGANNNTANISLTPLPTYLLSGYVTNASNSAAISGATVTTNTSQTTTTNATGYYNFTLSNGTYLITASMTNYNDNSTTRTVNGTAVSGVNIMLTPVPPSVGKIQVATNRYVILDDYKTTTNLGTGFSSPGTDHGTTNSWTGKNTKINATALFIDNNGFPINGTNITFTLYNPGGGVNATNYSTTNSYGLANFSFDLDAKNYYGNWTVRASNGSLYDNTSFIYNWWGCGSGSSSCTGGGHGSQSPSGTQPINSPYLSGRESPSWSSHSSASFNCTDCHQSFDGKPGGNTVAGANHTMNTTDVHKSLSCDNANCHQSRTAHSTNAAIGSCYNATGGCHGNGSAWDRKDLSNKSTLNGIVSNYSQSPSGIDDFHTPNSTVPCIICHGPMHNISKPDPTTGPRNNITEDSQCTTCHTSYTEHNSSNTTSGGVNCTLCHSDDVHDIQVFSNSATYINLNRTNPTQADLQNRGNCTNCHQNATFFGILENTTRNPTAGNYTGRDPPIIPAPMNHSTDPVSGALWNGSQSAYWDNTSQKSACYYCHGATLHSTSALGSISNVRGTNNLNQDLTTSRWCANCHYQTAPDYGGDLFTPQPPEVLNASGFVPATSRNGTGFINHSTYFSSGYNDSVCKDCHNNNLAASATSLNFSHNVAIGSGGAPNCIQCHNLVTGLSGGAPSGVNFTSANLSVHYGINSQNATNWSYAPVVGACWACHDTVGNVSTGHPDRYKTPKGCDDCHLAAGTYYNQSQKWGLNVTVSEHYYSGNQIHAGNSSSNISSCINCHENISEMILYNNDTDTGSFTGDGVRLTGGNKSFYHYGKNRSDIRIGASANCSYCHQNASTAFSGAMANAAYNKSIQNHSQGSSPNCFNANCHDSGWIHNSTLTKPAFSLPNSSLCLSCHGTGSGNASIRNLSQHNGTVNCTQCHLNDSRSIHPVRYLQQDGSNFNTSRTNTVNCTNCHQAKLANFSDAPIIPDPLKHSGNLTNGTIWGNYWTTEKDSCYYCHNNTKHNSTALGKISSLLTDTNNTRNGSLSTTTWCADCHYNATVNTNYKGNEWTQAPPLITANNTGKNYWINHSTYLSGGYKDSACVSCHALNGTYLSTSLNYSHSLNEGTAGGPDCISCHNTGGSAGPGRLVNFSAMNDTSALHKNLNSGASSGSLSAENKKCWACHGSGSNPGSNHPANYKTPYQCVDCHVPNVGQNLNFTPNTTLLNVTQHYWNGSNISTSATSCYSCHNRTEMMVGLNLDPDGAASVYGGANGGSNSSSHYGKKRSDMAGWDTTTYCAYCHNTTTSNVTFGVGDFNNSIYNHTSRASTPLCITCHNNGRIHNSTLAKPVSNDSYCSTCHGIGGSAQTNNKSRHKALNCTECHANNTVGTLAGKDIHAIKYLTQSNTYSTANTSAVNCVTCHQTNSVDSSLSGFTPFKISNPLHHSDDISNGSVWGSYWTNTTPQTACIYCHSDTRHNATPLGRILKWASGYAMYGGIGSNTSCANCHYKGDSNYTQMNSAFTSSGLAIPPEITNVSSWNGKTSNYYNHSFSSYMDLDCKSCHGSQLSASPNMSEFQHTVATGIAGGPNCIQCHNLVTGLSGGAPVGINFAAANLSVHYGINSNNATNKGYAPVVGACWACHDSNGNVTSGHPDRYKTPKACTECHLGTGTYNSSAYNAIVVWEHYQSGEELTAGNSTSNIASCINCHENVSEMVLYNNDTDMGSFAGDGIRLSGGNMSFYHYGKDRPDLRTGTGSKEAKCLYCHQNTSTAFTIAMQKPGISERIENHTDNPTQRCATCHGANSWIHNKTLTIPNLGVVDNTYCLSCHQSGIGGGRAIPETHNGAMNCWNCHQNSNTSENPMNQAPIHGMMYAQTNGSYQRFIKGSPANCTTCHVYNLVNTSSNTATRIPPLNHSTDVYSGKKWGNYWDNTSMITACNFCHQSELHNVNAVLLGNISTIKGNNQYKSSYLASSRWCSACHYNDSSSNYKGTILSPVPPEILNKSGTVPQNANDGTAFYNHSNDMAANSNDSKCKECHALVGSYAETTLNFSHSLNEGGGGPDCVSSGCHGSVGSPTSPYMNWTSLKSGMHSKLNSGADTTGMTDPIVAACWACHGGGTKPSGHPSNYKQPYNCTACHLASGSQAGRYNAKNVTEHQHVGARVLTNSTYARCENCHNNSLVTYYDNETSSLTNYTTGNVSHYGANKTAGKLMYNSSGNSEDCVYCHLNNSNRQKWANATNASATKPEVHSIYNVTTESSVCWNCHVDGGSSGVTAGFTLHNVSLNPGASEFCLSCHVTGGSAQNLNVTGERMGAHINLNNTPTGTLNNSDCWSCHFGYPNGTTGSHSFNVNRQNTYYCNDCHGPNKNATAVSQNIDAKTKIISQFQHATLDCGGCHAANDTRRPGGIRVQIYHNSSAKRNASGVVSNPGWDMINGMYTGCTDCHRIQNTRDGPFRGPGQVHVITADSNCGGNNCHSPQTAAAKANPHYQVYLPCSRLPCTPRPSVSPPVLSNLNLSPPTVPQGINTILKAKAQDNYDSIENATYRIINASGTVVDWTQMTPTDGRWGPSMTENLRADIGTSALSPGVYTIEIKAMAGGPRVKLGRYYPDNGEWSAVYSITLEVTS